MVVFFVVWQEVSADKSRPKLWTSIFLLADVSEVVEKNGVIYVIDEMYEILNKRFKVISQLHD